MRMVRAAGAAVCALLGVVAPHARPAGAAPAARLVLPKPVGAIPVVAAAFPDRPDRLTHSVLPGPVDDTERVEVAVGPDGVPATVALTQRLVLSGTGQFIVRERSSAQDVEALEDTVAPVLKREAVIWQGFVNGRKPLVARLTLDPAVEAALLPIGVELVWHGPGAIAPGGTLPGAGEVVVRLSNKTSRGMSVSTGDVAAADLAAPLDALLAHARSRSIESPPMAGRGLPESLAARSVAAPHDVSTVAPFRVTGTIRVPGGTPVTDDSGGVRRLADGLRLDGVLAGSAEFAVRATGGAALEIDLTAYPTLDERLLLPPRGHTWADWLRLGPTPAETHAAVDQLVAGAAAAARDDEYAPYLGHHGPGPVRTTYRFRVAPREAVRVVARPLRPKAFPIALASLALLAILGNAAAIHRRL